MAIQQIKAKVTSGDRANEEFVVNLDIPESIDEAKEKLGEPLVFSYFLADYTIAAQSMIRSHIKKDGATPETVQKAMDEWKPGVKVRGKPLKEKALDLVSRLTDEERAELIAALA